MAELELSERDGRVVVSVRVQPRASRTEVSGVSDAGALRVRLRAPPVDGAANKELLRFVGRKVLGIAPSNLEILRGLSSRDKVVAVSGLSVDEVRARLLG